MIRSDASNIDNIVDFTMSDTDGDIGKNIGNGVGTLIWRLQFVFCMLFIFWQEQENKVSQLVGVILMFVILSTFAFLSILLMELFEAIPINQNMFTEYDVLPKCSLKWRMC